MKKEILLDHFTNMFLISKRHKTVIISETLSDKKIFMQWK